MDIDKGVSLQLKFMAVFYCRTRTSIMIWIRIDYDVATIVLR